MGEINFSIFHLTQYLPDDTISTWDPYKKLLRYFPLFFSCSHISKTTEEAFVVNVHSVFYFTPYIQNVISICHQYEKAFDIKH